MKEYACITGLTCTVTEYWVLWTVAVAGQKVAGRMYDVEYKNLEFDCLTV
jgi:hypothetical protein